MPWKLTEDAHSYIVNWLVLTPGPGLGGGGDDRRLVIRRAPLKLHDLYLPGRRLPLKGGWNPRRRRHALGCALAWGPGHPGRCDFSVRLLGRFRRRCRA